MIHTHLTAMVLALILFAVILMLQGQGKETKIWQMVLRVIYIVLFITGFMLFFSLYNITFMYVLKGIVGLVMIGVFEMVIGRNGRGRAVGPMWIVFAVVLVLVILLGMMLPLGMDYI